MEKDDEVKGEGNSYDFGARMYDSRLGRWLSIDAFAGKYPNVSTYAFVANMPIIAIDPNGKEIIVTTSINSETGKTVVNISLSGKVVFDYLSNSITHQQKLDYTKKINEVVETIFTKEFENYEVNVTSNLIVSDEKSIEDADHVIYIMNFSTGKEQTDALSSVGGFVSSIGGKKAFFSKTVDLEIAAHEIGHWFGLLHPKTIRDHAAGGQYVEGEFIEANSDDIYNLFSNNNIMHHIGDPGTKYVKKLNGFDELQVKMIIESFEKGYLNKGTNKKLDKLHQEFVNAGNSSSNGPKYVATKIVYEILFPKKQENEDPENK
jgi:RHS repeat-associated protein